jgi:hypothetical protein
VNLTTRATSGHLSIFHFKESANAIRGIDTNSLRAALEARTDWMKSSAESRSRLLDRQRSPATTLALRANARCGGIVKLSAAGQILHARRVVVVAHPGCKNPAGGMRALHVLTNCLRRKTSPEYGYVSWK